MKRPLLRVARCARVLLPLVLLAACRPDRTAEPDYDVLIRNGLLIDGSGAPGVRADLAISGDTVAALGDLSAATATTTVDAAGLVVAPGFINMLSWANEALIEDGRSLSG